MSRPALLALLLATPAAAQDQDTIDEALAYAWSNSMYTMYHEIGHMFVDQFGLPVLAREEDAVDNLATLMVLEDFAQAEDRILDDAAYGWALSEAWGEEVDESSLADEHSLDQQRAYAMVCLMVGSDPDAFGPVADDWAMDPDRQDGCGAEFEQASASWDAVLGPFRGSSEPGTIAVAYDEPDAEVAEVAAYLAGNGILEAAAARVEDGFALPGPVTFRAAMCGEDNAFYDPSVPEVVLCYEHAQGHFDRYLADLTGEAGEAAGE